MVTNDEMKRTILSGYCPDCGTIMGRRLTGSGMPICESCDAWWEIDGNGWVVKNIGAHEEDMARWEQILREQKEAITDAGV